jgi:hypothetical protein
MCSTGVTRCCPGFATAERLLASGSSGREKSSTTFIPLDQHYSRVLEAVREQTLTALGFMR